jgi:hypothetical protein
MLAAALATLAFALNNALHAGSRQVADSLAGSTGGVSTQ